MSQGDVYANPSPRMAKTWPYVVVLQDDRFFRLDSVVVAPCAAASRGGADERLTPMIQIDGKPFYALIPAMAAMPRNTLQGAPIANVIEARARLLSAIDRLFTGI